MAIDIRIEENHIPEFKAHLDAAIVKILTIIGMKAERYAKALCPVGTSESTGKKGYRGGTLRNSITHQVQDKELAVGTNVEYGPYVELGTGPYFQPPPEWEQFESSGGSGIGHGYVKPRKFLQPAIIDHVSEYETIMKNELSGL